MNITMIDSQLLCEAKICGCSSNKRVVYSFSEPVHGLCIDRKQLIFTQIQACRNLLRYTTEESELFMVEKEIDELTALC
ncbi:MAG TPA: hypothetical protein VJU13_05840 [Candidatus Nitrosocosmicus sp.]|jgi:hypothetical protein|nr:hypothetical protein [Candidatus Nitrosocosmicus sp.]